MTSRHVTAALARAKSLSPDRRSEIAREAAKARWSNASQAQVIYVIGPEVGPVKIGISKKADSRLRSIQTGSPVKLMIHGTVDVGDCDARDVESLAHAMLHEARLSGEWFNVTAEDAVCVVSEAVVQIKNNPDAMKKKVSPGAKVLFAFRLDEGLVMQLDAWAKEKGISRTKAVEIAIRQVINGGPLKPLRPTSKVVGFHPISGDPIYEGDR